MSARTQKACQVCGKPFYGGDDHHYCPECARIKKLNTVVRIRKCQDCGVEFFGGPTAIRCPDCAHEAQKEREKRYRHNCKARRFLGSVDKCILCGTEYIVSSGTQKYCSAACRNQDVVAKEKVRERKRQYNRMTNQVAKKKTIRDQQEKVCVYCLRRFKAGTSTNLCSEFCRTEQKRLRQCKADIHRGYNRNYDKLIKRRDDYREEVAKQWESKKEQN